MLECLFVEWITASDAELAGSIAGGSASDAENELCRRFAPRIRLYGLRHLRDEHAAADLVQQVLLVLLESVRAGRVHDLEKLASFVLGTCRMAVLDLRRGTRRRAALLQNYAREHAQFAPPDEPLDAARLNDCMARLAAREQSVIVLTFYQEESSEAVAASLGLTSSNARVIRHRALAKLRTCLEAA
jgi:RNA polymerase sigma-70 factor (ECF subfamily)